MITRDRIFSAAKALLDQDGIANLTIRKVAARAGVSPMAMYRHFTDKSALLDALVSDGLDAWELAARSVGAKDPLQWLEELMDAYLDFALTQPHRYDAAFFLPAPNARQYPGDFAAGRSPVIAMIMVRIEQARATGRLGDKPALEIVLSLSALAQGLVSMQRANRFSDEKTFRTLFRTTMQTCIESYTKPPGKKVKQS
ncbi:MAG TPA: TetR/AcrR family transcriptional regulator [Steroidobacteraceae bacterium]|jgi:AcrR family transcriptional regulator